MDIYGVDLNLLLVFDTMYRHRSVTRAGEALGLSQPAMSAALARLRALFGDRLFVRSGSEMKPTPRAELLSPAVQEVVRMIEANVLQPAVFDPATSTRTFTLLTPDISEVHFLSRLLARLADVAPGVNIKTVAMPLHVAASSLEAGVAELAVGNYPDLHRAGFYRQPLFQTSDVCLLRNEHSFIREKLTLKQFLSASHAVVQPDGREHMFERFLQKQDIRRRIVVKLTHFMSLLPIVESSDIIATVPKELGDFFAAHGKVRYVEIPLKAPLVDVDLFWHERYQNDVAHAWFRKLMHEMFRNESGT